MIYRNKRGLTALAIAVLMGIAALSPAVVSADADAGGTTYRVEQLKAAQEYSQLIIVSGYKKNYAKVSMYTKNGDTWKRNFSTKGRVGTKGIGKARSNLSRTPRGNYCLYTAFGIKKNPGCKRSYTKVNWNHYWSAKTNRLQLGRTSGEHLITAGKAYNYAIGIGYNMKAKKGKGSAFFLHCLGRRGMKGTTAGCVAIPEKYMKKCLRNLRNDTRIIIDYSDKITNY